ncbi:MAG TPA: hypothetical protein VL096_01240, partial [Pirellulaceae bacterium]|nr:hypothetical protein [Pirellulaceae bacterium]
MVPLVIIISFAVISGLVFFLLLAFARLQYDPISERLASSAQGSVAASGPGLFTDDLAATLAAQLPQGSNDHGELDLELRQAGFYRPTARFDFLALRNSLVIAAIIIAATLAVGVGPNYQDVSLKIMIGGVVIAALCWAVPRLILRAQAAARVTRIRRGLPYALDMTTMCLTGGLSLQDSLGHVSREIYFSHPDLALELMIVRQQSEMT